ncbi:aldo/keto reductase [Saccharopolyspora flava]|uniref:Predicted oxidoreductase n=1 Tax=Saccharopolyspora flava TaxID=95161 RepID=A0A1I6U2V0_9PSEU|nr:aldo/keto reductase [Saccharopolyspora flava]SFS95745.1 Predicted oxidoreductase [Saccharopolyspora flava]
MRMSTLGSLSVPAVGFGAGGLTAGQEAIDTVRAAVNDGMTFLDTGDFYGSGLSEELLREALRPIDRDAVQLSVKFGSLRDPRGRFLGIEGRPAHVKNFLAYSLQRLGTDHVDVYRPARLDPTVPIEDTVGAIAELVEAGWVRHIGLSEVGPDTIRRAHAVHPIADVQIEYSIFSRGPERAVLPTCRELGIGVTAYGVLAHGLLTGSFRAGGPAPQHLPRLHPENLPANLALVERLRPIADAHDVTVAQLAIAWVLARGGDLVALVGASRPSRVPEAVAAAALALSPGELAAIDEAVPQAAVAGERYAAPLMASLDSER